MDRPAASFFPVQENAVDAVAEPKLERRSDRFELALQRASGPTAILPAALDGVLVAAIAVGISFIATVYPSWAAARILPAEALRYE